LGNAVGGGINVLVFGILLKGKTTTRGFDKRRRTLASRKKKNKTKQRQGGKNSEVARLVSPTEQIALLIREDRGEKTEEKRKTSTWYPSRQIAPTGYRERKVSNCSYMSYVC